VGDGFWRSCSVTFWILIAILLLPYLLIGLFWALIIMVAMLLIAPSLFRK
jgi:hypothetical protein